VDEGDIFVQNTDTDLWLFVANNLNSLPVQFMHAKKKTKNNAKY